METRQEGAGRIFPLRLSSSGSVGAPQLGGYRSARLHLGRRDGSDPLHGTAGVESLRTGRSSTEYDVELRQNVDRLHPGGYDNDAEQGRYYQQAAVKILASHPLLLARFCAMGTVKILGGTGLEMLLEWTGTRYSSDGAFRPRVTGQGTLALLRAHPSLIPLQAGYMAALMALYLAALAGWRRLWINGKAQAVFLTVCTLYLLGLSSTQGYYRYRIPMMPFLGAGACIHGARPPPRCEYFGTFLIMPPGPVTLLERPRHGESSSH